MHTDTWWLDAVTRQMVEQRLNLSGMLTFTLRGGRPINLTREQVGLHAIEFAKYANMLVLYDLLRMWACTCERACGGSRSRYCRRWQRYHGWSSASCGRTT